MIPYVELPEIPGIGLMVHSGGSFNNTNVQIGHEAGSVGILFVRGTADYDVPARFQVGHMGTGSVVQTGGTVTAGWCLELGSLPGALGSYTIENGTFEQTGVSPDTTRCNEATGAEGVYVGAGGVGTLHVLGNDAVINFGHYHQSADSTLAFTIDEDIVGNAVSTIQVTSTANFEVGANIRVALPTVVAGTPNPSSVDLLTATDGITGIANASDLDLVGPDAANWSLSIVNGVGNEQTLVATAVP